LKKSNLFNKGKRRLLLTEYKKGALPTQGSFY